MKMYVNTGTFMINGYFLLAIFVCILLGIMFLDMRYMVLGVFITMIDFLMRLLWSVYN